MKQQLTTTAHELGPLFSSVKLAHSRSFLLPRRGKNVQQFIESDKLHVKEKFSYFDTRSQALRNSTVFLGGKK